MLISHSKKFIFIHNYKVAGTSVRNVFLPYSCKSYKRSEWLTKLLLNIGVYPKIYYSDFDTHVTASAIKAAIPASVYNSYFKFGFVRNPWDWQVSLYMYMLKNTEHYQHGLIKAMSGFDEYIQWRIDKDLHLQKEFFYENGKCIVDYVGKLENVETDFKFICDKIGVDAALPHLNKSRDDNKFLQHYTPKSIAMVAEAFKEDIETFKYTIPIL